MSVSRLLRLTATCMLLLVAVTACDSTDSAEGGRLQVLLTDAPADDMTEAFVTIERVELLGGDDVLDVVMTEPETVDLLTLQDGVTSLLADADVPAGTYTQLRMVIADEAVVAYTDGTEQTLKVPSGTTTGIKILLPPFEIDDDEDPTVITIDFDVNESFVQAGNSGMVIFKPVLRPIALTVDGEPVVLDDDVFDDELG